MLVDRVQEQEVQRDAKRFLRHVAKYGAAPSRTKLSSHVLIAAVQLALRAVEPPLLGPCYENLIRLARISHENFLDHASEVRKLLLSLPWGYDLRELCKLLHSAFDSPRSRRALVETLAPTLVRSSHTLSIDRLLEDAIPCQRVASALIEHWAVIFPESHNQSINEQPLRSSSRRADSPYHIEGGGSEEEIAEESARVALVMDLARTELIALQKGSAEWYKRKEGALDILLRVLEEAETRCEELVMMPPRELESLRERAMEMEQEIIRLELIRELDRAAADRAEVSAEIVPELQETQARLAGLKRIKELKAQIAAAQDNEADADAERLQVEARAAAAAATSSSFW